MDKDKKDINWNININIGTETIGSIMFVIALLKLFIFR